MESLNRYIEKSVIIHRDESGFGFRVSGQNPVFVDCVYENGNAWKAGVRRNDLIIKVNGTLVRSYDHQEVVRMIQNCTRFVNLTLHSPEPMIVSGSFPTPSNTPQSGDLIPSSGILSATNNNLAPSGIKVLPIHQRLQTNNLSWLSDIGDDLFQDYQQVSIENNIQSAHQTTGVSKLIEGGPSPITSNQSSFTGGVRPKIRQNRNQASTRDNPYYYYKTVTEKNSEITTNTSANTSPSSQDPSSSRAGSISIVRSRSSGKMSIRSSSSTKRKTRKLRSRLVSDFRSLTIANIQTTPSSLSTSPSSSDLSDCDDPDSSRPDMLSLNASNASMTGANAMNKDSNSSNSNQPPNQVTQKLRLTTRRLEIIRELVDTEKTHTERLKHLNDLLYKPIKAEGLVPIDQLKMIFSCHKTLFKIHRKIYKILVAAQLNVNEQNQEPLIGRALVDIFEGDLGKRLEKAASSFCACQSTNAELLNRITRKDTKAGEFLAQVANQQLLGRLGIKDLLASCFQRLTKYPLLLDNLLKATPTGTCCIHSKSLSDGSIALKSDATFGNHDTNLSINEDDDSEELTNSKSAIKSADRDDDVDLNTTPSLEEEYAYERLCISRALQQSRHILTHVNEAVKRAMSHNRLLDLWKKTDKSPDLWKKTEKDGPPPVPEIDIDSQQILHEGPLTLRLSRRSFEVYVLLLTDFLVILTREGQDKYKLKFFTADGNQFSPIFNIDEHLATRDTATDENGFYLLCKRKKAESIYEFASQSPVERAKWKEKIHAAQQFHYAVVPDDDNTLTRYRELITLDTSSNTPDNIEHSSVTNVSLVVNTTSVVSD